MSQCGTQEKVELIGYENETQNVGRIIPGFSDFFHLHAGDVLFWHYTEDGFMPSNYYYKDSIVNDTHAEDSVTYEIIRNSYNGTEEQTVIYTESYYRPFLNSSSNRICMSSGVPVYGSNEEISFWHNTELIINDSITSLGFVWYGESFYIPNCDLVQITDVGYHFELNTTYGLAEHCGLGWGSRCHTVVGATINGEDIGQTDVNIETNNIEIPNPEMFQVYPNPCINKLYHNITQNIHPEYKIVNLYGQVLQAGRIDKSYIETQNLPGGTYELIIENKLRKKILKIER